MKGDLATMVALDGRGIRDMVEMPVGDHEQAHFLAFKSLGGPLRRVEKDVSPRCFQKKSVRIQRPARKRFEPIHVKVVEYEMSRLIFRAASASFCASSTMKPSSLARRAALLLPVVLLAGASGLFGRTSIDPGQVAMSVARWLEQGHYTRQKVNDEMSEKLLTTYLRGLDYNKLYFTQKDIDQFEAKYGSTLDDSILRGDLEPARDIFAVFKTRVEDRVAKNKELTKKKFTFKENRTVELNREDSAWPADMAAADQIWRDRIEAELLKEELSDLKIRSPQETVAKRYDQILRNIREMNDEDVVKSFLTALAQSYDPHSEYLSASDLENFQVQMGLSLEGVGAVLRSDDGYAKVVEVVPGGPASREGSLKVNDRIAAVGQGKDGELEDVVDMRLDKVVEKIRGKKGSIVRLVVLPAKSTDPAERKVVELRRDKVELKEQAAKAEVLDVKNGNDVQARIGWITLPSFYANMKDRSEENARSTTQDVSALLTRLKKENIQGLVIDLRRDGGGSLEEAINLTGLFIPKGPVVQAKDTNGKITVSRDTNPEIEYDGPMVVLMNRLSASASEIFAAALQDYGRAVIVGDERSFGKGTVQTVLELGRFMPIFNLGTPDAGALKLTIQKFYRVKGGSTQLNGVSSDIVLPSVSDNPEIGEGALKNRLPYDEVAPLKIASSPAEVSAYIEELKNRSSTRVAKDPEFDYIVQDSKKLSDKLKANQISLNKDVRSKEMKDEKKIEEQRKTERASRGPAIQVNAYELTLDDVDAEKLKSVAYDRKRSARYEEEEEAESADKQKENEVEPDPVRDEALRIVEDLINLSNQTKTASVPSANTSADDKP